MAKDRYKVIASGIFGLSGEVPVGTEIETNSDIPAGWAGKVVLVSSKRDKEAAIAEAEAMAKADAEAAKAKAEAEAAEAAKAKADAEAAEAAKAKAETKK